MSLTLTAALNSQIQPLATEQTLTMFTLPYSEGILWGLEVTAQDVPDLTVNVAAGSGMVNTDVEFKKYPFILDNPGVLSFATAPSLGQSRIDLVVAKITKTNSQLTNAVIDIVVGDVATTGTEVPPVLTETSVEFYLVLASINIVGGSNAITGSQITSSGSITDAGNINLQPLNNPTTFEISPFSVLGNEYIETGRFVEKIGDTMTGTLDFSGVNGKLKVPTLETTDIATSLITAGQVAYDSLLNLFKFRDNSGVFSFIRNVANVITTSNINDLAVTTPKIADNAVTQAKLSADLSFMYKNDVKTTKFYNFTRTGSKTAGSEFGFVVDTTGNPITTIDSTGYFIAFATNSGSNAAAYSETLFFRRSQNPTMIVKCRTQGTLESYYWVGLFSNITVSATDNGTQQGISFRFKNGTDTGWRPSCYDGTTQTLGANIGTVAINTTYWLKFRVDDALGKAFFSVATTPGVFSAEVEISANLPSSSTDLYWIQRTVRSSGAVVSSAALAYSSVLIEHN